jgi:hypothetical protein
MAIALALFLSGSNGFAQIGGGAIRGTVRNPDGIVAGASIQAKQQSTGKTFTTISGKSGEYAVTGLPDGPYEISVPQLGITSARFVQQDVVIQVGKWELAPGEEILESICNENNKFEENAGLK